MKHYFLFTRVVFALALTVVLIGFSAFSQNQKKGGDSFRKEQLSQNNNTDTSGRRNSTDRDIDQLDEQMRRLDIQMKDLDIQIKNLDFEKYQKQLNEAIQKIDMDSFSDKIDKSMKNIDWDDMRYQLKKGAKVNQKLMEQVKLNFEKQKAEFRFNSGKMKENFEKSMKNGCRLMENAKEDLKNFMELTNALEKDGLMDKSKGYKIELQDDELYINDKKQSKEISDKYRKYYREGNFTIDINEENGIRI
jgi:hypothetical protein